MCLREQQQMNPAHGLQREDGHDRLVSEEDLRGLVAGRDTTENALHAQSQSCPTGLPQLAVIGTTERIAAMSVRLVPTGLGRCGVSVSRWHGERGRRAPSLGGQGRRGLRRRRSHAR